MTTSTRTSCAAARMLGLPRCRTATEPRARNAQSPRHHPGLSLQPRLATGTITLLVPYVDAHALHLRRMRTSSQPLPELSSSRSSSIGDLTTRSAATRASCRPATWASKLGVKLPTGQATARPSPFYAGSRRPGTPLDASLQPGTGSTDVILVTATTTTARSARTSTSSRTDNSKARSRTTWTQPGNELTAPATPRPSASGLRYENNPATGAAGAGEPAAQGARPGRAPRGRPEVPPANVTPTSAPGSTAQASHRQAAPVFGFVQVPAATATWYGYQLFPQYTVSVGVSYAL